MILALLIGLVLTGVTAVLILRAVAMPRIDAVARLGQIQAYGFGNELVIDAEPAGRSSVLDKLAAAAGQVVAGRMKAFDEAEVRKVLMTAGIYTTTPTTFMGYRALTTLGLTLTMLWYMTAAGAGALTLIAGLSFGIFGGWWTPMAIVSRRARKRYERVERDLPELIDLLIVTVEAGLGFNGSMQITAQRLGGPLGDELRLTLQEQRMGLPTSTALKNMLERADTPSMRSFVRSVLQGETLGVSIGQIMRALAIEMRKRRRAAIEERAQKAPIKLLFPLVFLIFPSMFIVLLFPAVYSFLQGFGGS